MPDVASACKACYGPKKACNFFVQAVARMVNVPLPSSGKADPLIAALAVHWVPLTEHDAIIAATRGQFVVAGMTSKELGEGDRHVAVVLPGQLAGFPRVASTNEGDKPDEKSEANTPLTRVFPARKVRAGKVHYFTAPSRGAPGSW